MDTPKKNRKDKDLETPEKPSRRVGRPTGTFGSHALRRRMAEQREAKKSQALEVPKAAFFAARDATNQKRKREAAARREGAFLVPLPKKVKASCLRPLGVLGQSIIKALEKSSSGARLVSLHHRQQLASLLAVMCTGRKMIQKAKLMMVCKSWQIESVRKQRMLDQLGLAGLVWACSHVVWGGLFSWIMQHIQRGDLEGIAFVSHVSFDETSANLSMTAPQDEHDVPGLTCVSSTHRERVKVFGTKHHLSIVLRGKDLTNNQIVVLTGELVVPLLAAERNTAECAYGILDRQKTFPLLSALSKLFRFVCSSATADRAASNLRLLRARLSFEPGVAQLKSGCQVHAADGAWVYGLGGQAAEHISARVHLALLTRPAGSARDLRECLCGVLRERWRIHEFRSSLPPDHADVRARRQLLALCLPGAFKSPPILTDKRRYIVLDALCNGKVDHCSIERHGGVWDKEAAIGLISGALLPRPFEVLQRARWHKDSIALGNICLFFCFGGLGVLALRRWLAPASQRDAAKQIKWTFLPQALQDKQDGEHLSCDDVGAAGREEKQDTSMLQKQTSRSRKVVAKYAATQPELSLRGLLTCSEPHMSLLAGLLEDSSVEATAKKFSAVYDGADVQEAQYDVVHAGTNRRCYDYFRDVSSLLASAEVWMFAGSSKSYALIGEASSLLTRAAAHVHRDVFCRNRECPVLTFKLLYDKGFAYEFDRIRWCMLDAFSWSFRECFPSISELQSDEAEATLAGLAAVQRVDTVPNECIFSALHRALKEKMDYKPSLAQLSAEKLVRDQQIIEDEMGWAQTRAAAQKQNMQRANEQLKSEVVAGGQLVDEVPALVDEVLAQRRDTTPWRGGPWRAFCSQYLAMCRSQAMEWDTRALAQEYHVVKAARADEWTALVKKGELLRTAGKIKREQSQLKLGMSEMKRQRISDAVKVAFQPSRPDTLAIQDEDSLVYRSMLAMSREKAQSTPLALMQDVEKMKADVLAAVEQRRKEEEQVVSKLVASANRDRERDAAFLEQWPITPFPLPTAGSTQYSMWRFVAPALSLARRVLTATDQWMLPAACKHWETTHRLLGHDGCTPLLRKAEIFGQETWCRRSGMCLCGPRGGLLHAFFRVWRRALHEVLKPEGLLRKEHKGGHLFLEFINVSAVEPSESTFWHLSAINGTDFTGTVQLLEAHKATTFARRVAADGGAAKALQRASMDENAYPLSFMRVHEALSALQFDGCHIAMRAWTRRLSGFVQDTDSLTPADIVVERHEWQSDFWGGSPPAWARPKKRTRQPGNRKRSSNGAGGERRRPLETKNNKQTIQKNETKKRHYNIHI